MGPLLRRHRHLAPRLRAEVPADLAAVVARAMAKSPLDLVPSTHELKTLLGLRGAAADANAPAWL